MVVMSTFLATTSTAFAGGGNPNTSFAWSVTYTPTTSSFWAQSTPGAYYNIEAQSGTTDSHFQEYVSQGGPLFGFKSPTALFTISPISYGGIFALVSWNNNTMFGQSMTFLVVKGGQTNPRFFVRITNPTSVALPVQYSIIDVPNLLPTPPPFNGVIPAHGSITTPSMGLTEEIGGSFGYNANDGWFQVNGPAFDQPVPTGTTLR